MLNGAARGISKGSRRNSKETRTGRKGSKERDGVISGAGRTIQNSTTRNARSISNREQMPFATNNVWKGQANKTMEGLNQPSPKRSNSNGK